MSYHNHHNSHIATWFVAFVLTGLVILFIAAWISSWPTKQQRYLEKYCRVTNQSEIDHGDTTAPIYRCPDVQ